MDKNIVSILLAQLSLAKSQRNAYIEACHRLKRGSYQEASEDIEECDRELESLNTRNKNDQSHD